MKKHEFKSGDGFRISSEEQGIKFLKLANQLGYYVHDFDLDIDAGYIEYWKGPNKLGFISSRSVIHEYTEEQMFGLLGYNCMDSLGNPIKEGDEVYISDVSVADAIKTKSIRVFFMLRSNFYWALSNNYDYERVEQGQSFGLTPWKYVVSTSCVPKEKVVCLNNEYKAIVTKDSVKVGCQTFSKEKILEVVEALKSFD